MQRVSGNLRWAALLLAVVLLYCPRCDCLRAADVPATRPAEDSEAQKDRNLIVRGRVVLPDGRPAAGAKLAITAQVFVSSNNRRSTRTVSTAAICDSGGSFSCEFKTPAAHAVAWIDARGTFAGQVFKLMCGGIENEIRLLAGTQVRGQVMHLARPQRGIHIVLAEVFASAGSTRSYEAVTGEDGRFAIDQLPPDREFHLFTPMRHLASQNLGAIRQVVRTAADGRVTDLAEINLHAAHSVRGRIVGQKIREELRVVISRADVNDAQRTMVNDDGTFFLQGISRDRFNLSVETIGEDPTWRYLLSGANQSLNHADMTQLCGRVDHDLELTISLSGSRLVKDTRPRAHGQGSPPRLVMARVVLNGRVQNAPRVAVAGAMNPSMIQQHQLLGRPLCGVFERREP